MSPRLVPFASGLLCHNSPWTWLGLLSFSVLRLFSNRVPSPESACGVQPFSLDIKESSSHPVREVLIAVCCLLFDVPSIIS